MVGTTLVEIRRHIEALASTDGEYYIVCGRTGERPVPAAGERFDERAIARSAARATEQYRTALRQYDPQVPYYDPIVCQDAVSVTAGDRLDRRARDAYPRTLSEPVLDGRSTPHERRDLVEFCHRVAGAVFETLSENGHKTVESAIMDAYFELAETVGDPNALCLCLLESMATELDDRLRGPEQATIIADAARRLGPTDATATPVMATLSFLEDRGLVGGYTCSSRSIGLEGCGRSVVVRLSGYVLSPRGGRLPVLPIALELYRRQPGRANPSLSVSERDGDWCVRVALAETNEPTGLTSASIDAAG